MYPGRSRASTYIELLKGSCEGVIRFPEQKPYTVWRALQYLYTGEFSTEDKFDGGNDKDPAGGIMGMRPPHTFPEAKPFSELTNIIFVYNFAVMYDLQVLKEEARSLLSSKLRVVSEIDIIIAIGLMHAADYKDPKWFLSDIIKGLLTRITSASAQPTGKVPALLATPQYAPIVMPLMLQHLWRYGNTSKVMADFMFSAQVSDAVAGKGQGKAKRTQPKVKPAVFPKCSCGDFADEFDSRKVAFWCGNFECSSITGVAAKNSNPEPPAGSSTGV